MEKYCWKAKIKLENIEEYKKRHTEIWDEMKDELRAAGICNYSIWLVDDILFGYYECKYGKDFAMKYQNESNVVKKWRVYMADIIEDVIPSLECVFFLE